MISKEYLRQAYRLDHRINSDIEEMERLRDMAGVSSASLEERPSPCAERNRRGCLLRKPGGTA